MQTLLARPGLVLTVYGVVLFWALCYDFVCFLSLLAISAGVALLMLLIAFAESSRFWKGLLTVLGVVALSVLIWYFTRLPRIVFDRKHIGTVTKYTAKLWPKDRTLSSFVLVETAHIQESVLQPPPNLDEDPGDKPPPKAQAPEREPRQEFVELAPRELYPKWRGLFVQALAFKPLDVAAPKNATVEIFGKKGELDRLVYDRPDAFVQMIDMLPNSFRQARDSKADVRGFANEEETVNIRFDVLDPKRGVTILYLRPPFQHLHWLPDALVYSRSWWDFVAAAFMLLVSLIPGALVYVFKEQLKDWLKKKFGAKPAATSPSTPPSTP